MENMLTLLRSAVPQIGRGCRGLELGFVWPEKKESSGDQIPAHLFRGVPGTDLPIHWPHDLRWKQAAAADFTSSFTSGNVRMVDVPEPSWGARLSANPPFHLSDSATLQADLKPLKNEWKGNLYRHHLPTCHLSVAWSLCIPTSKAGKGPREPLSSPRRPWALSG